MCQEIKEARIKAGLTQREMSKLLGIPRRTIEDWDRGIQSPSEWIKNLLVEKLDSIAKEKEAG